MEKLFPDPLLSARLSLFRIVGVVLNVVVIAHMVGARIRFLLIRPRPDKPL